MLTTDGSTAVHRACHDSHHEALEILLSCGANAEIQDVQGRAPIHWACTTKNRQCLEVSTALQGSILRTEILILTEHLHVHYM